MTVSYENDEMRSIERFIKHVKQSQGKDISMHNLYLIRKYDKNGVLTDEKFGVNLITDHGLLRVDNASGTFRLICGTGTVTPDYADISIGTSAFAVYPTITIDYLRFPMTYDSNTDLIRTMYRFGMCEYDYNLDGVSADIEVTHFGLYSSKDNGQKLLTHSLVYDDQGQVSSFTKHPDEKINITIYMAAVCRASLIEDAYENGIYISLSSFTEFVRWTYSQTVRLLYENNWDETLNGFFTTYIPGTSSSNTTGFFGDDGDTVDSTTHIRTSTRERKPADSSIITLNSKHISQLCFNWPQSMTVTFDVKLSQPEELSCDCVYTDGNQTGDLTCVFGRPPRDQKPAYNQYNSLHTSWGFLPVNDFVITSAYMWDYSTKDWTIQEQFNNPAAGKYVFEPVVKSANDREGKTSYTTWAGSSQSWKGYQALRILNQNNTQVEVFIRVNKYPDIPIKRFITDGSSMLVYGTDTYWDGSTYVPIPTYGTEIPAEHRNYKYYLFTNDISAQVEYIYSDHTDVPHIILPQQPYEIDLTGLIDDHLNDAYGFATATTMPRSLNLLASSTNGWIATAANVIYPHAQGGPVVHSLIPWYTGEPNYRQHKLKDVVLVDDSQSINQVTWASGYFDSTGTLVSSNYHWYTNEYFDITGYQQLCWQATFDPGISVTGAVAGDKMVFYLYDENKDFIKCVESLENSSRYITPNGIYDNLPENVKYFRFGYWRPFAGSGSTGTNSTDNIKYLSYSEVYQFLPAFGKRFATHDRLVMVDTYQNHGDDDHYRQPWNNGMTYQSRQGQFTHTGCMIAKLGDDPTAAPTFQYIKFPFHVPYTNFTINMSYRFDEYTGMFVVSKWKKSMNGDDIIPNKIFGVDLYGVDAGTSDPFDNDAEMFYIGDGFGCNICKKYKWCAYFDASDYNIIHAYDLEERQEICTFTIDPSYTIDGYCDLFLNGDYVYVTCMMGTKKTVIMCDIGSGRWEEVENFSSPDMYDFSYYPYSYLNNANWAHGEYLWSRHIDAQSQAYSTMNFNDGDFMWLTGSFSKQTGTGSYSGIVTSENPRNWVSPSIQAMYLSGSSSSSNVYEFSPIFSDPQTNPSSNNEIPDYGFSKLILSEDGKHLLGVGYGRTYINTGNSTITRYCVFDAGMYLNNGQKYRYANDTKPYIYISNPQGTTPLLAKAAITYFKGGIVAYAPTTLKWSPLACWLPHKITGTTYTIQAYNNPKKISGGSLTLNISNRVPAAPI